MTDKQKIATPKSVAVLGATGSIGRACLDLIGRDSSAYGASLLAAATDYAGLADLAIRHKPRHVVLMDEAGIDPLAQAITAAGLNKKITIQHGMAALLELLKQDPADLTINAIAGSAGLLPSLTVIQQGGVLGLANKESLVAAGGLLMAEAAQHQATILPIDSEHNAIFQLWQANHAKTLTGIVLTASGGALRDTPRAQLAKVTPEVALRHPTWQMGRKITIDSATMMNKALEVIEACVLFGLDESQVGVVLHRQSIIHAMLNYADGSSLAHLSRPDMRVALSYVLGWPDRLAWGGEAVDLLAVAQLDFAPLASTAVELARAAWRAGGLAATVLNAANEVAVAAFLDKRIGFLDIIPCVSEALLHVPSAATINIDAVVDAHQTSTRQALAWIDKRARVVKMTDTSASGNTKGVAAHV